MSFDTLEMSLTVMEMLAPIEAKVRQRRKSLADAMAFLLANARRSNPKRDRRAGRLRAGPRAVGARRYVITYEPGLAGNSISHLPRTA